MKKNDQTHDEFFRNILGDYPMIPSEKAREAFLKDALKIVQPKPGGRKGLIWLSALVVLLGTGIAAWLLMHPGSAGLPKNGSGTRAVAMGYKANTGGNAGCKKQDAPRLVAGSITASRYQKAGKADRLDRADKAGRAGFTGRGNKASSEGNEIQKGESGFPAVAEVTSKGIPQGGNEAGVSETRVMPPDTGKQGSHPDPAITRQDSIIKMPDSVSLAFVKSQVPRSISSGKPPSKWYPAIGVYYAPEWMQNTLEGGKVTNNFGVEGTFHFGRYSIRTGAGLSVSEGSHERSVGYNDYLGSYNRLDSIDFTWSAPQQKLIPTYYLSKEDVWDSLLKLDYLKITKRYTYLQIPMIMGYDFWQSDRMSLGIRVGPVMSVFLSSKQLSADYDPGNKRVVSVNDISPGQVNLNWQALGGVDATFILSKEFMLELEPSVRYYFNSVYEKPVNSAKPWSISIRAAFSFKFE